MDWFFVGVDLGQTRDPTAIAVVERAETEGEFDATVWASRKTVELRLRKLERIPLGTSYPEVVSKVVELTRSRALAGRCHLAVDGTGVGQPVVDLLRDARPGCNILPVKFTGGGAEGHHGGYYTVPKRDLITGLQTLIQTRDLKIAGGMAEGEALFKEMGNMRVRVSTAGWEQFDTWRQNAHDDLVFATALACWAAKKVMPLPAPDRDEWWVGKELWL
jgi:hypothetical protein